VKCKDFGQEYLLAFSCKGRHFYPSCHQERVVKFGDWLCMDVLKKCLHCYFVFSMPKILWQLFYSNISVINNIAAVEIIQAFTW
jgi:hypothetical protein